MGTHERIGTRRVSSTSFKASGALSLKSVRTSATKRNGLSIDAKNRLYKTETVLNRELRVAYPAGNGRLVLRTDQDWDKDVEPVSRSEDGTTWTFRLEADQPFLYFKPCLNRDGEHHWAVGPNKLLIMKDNNKRISFPSFFSEDKGTFSELIELPSKILSSSPAALMRLYLPLQFLNGAVARHREWTIRW